MTSFWFSIPFQICPVQKLVRPAVVVSAPHVSQDILITPLTSKTGALLEGEFVLSEWASAGLNVC
ncbi:hypothetical protein [Nostoc sp.]